MKAISLHQPYASLIAAGAKRIETRDWFPQCLRPGQLVAIHAAKHWTSDERALCEEDPFFHRYLTLAQRRGLWSWAATPTQYLGGVVAIARFQGAYPTEEIGRTALHGRLPPAFTVQKRLWISDHEAAFGNYAPGRYGWVFSEVRPVAIIPVRGQQGLFEWDAMREIANLYQEPVNRMKTPLTPSEESGGPGAASVALTDTQALAMPSQPTRVVHCRKETFDVYIGRQMKKYPDLKATGWGNPYWEGVDTPAGRQSAIDRYREWVLTQPKLLTRLPELRGRTLGCWCAPLGGLPGNLYGRVCHGEVLAALADGWCAQCQEITSPGHVRLHESGLLTIAVTAEREQLASEEARNE